MGIRSTVLLLVVLTWLIGQALSPSSTFVVSQTSRVVEPRTFFAPTAQQGNLSLSLAVDAQTVPNGTEVTISGAVTFSNGTGVMLATVSIAARNPYGSTVAIRRTFTDSRGKFGAAFVIPEGSPTGEYSIDVVACRATPYVCTEHQSVPIVISPADFALTVAPRTEDVEQGNKVSFNVTISPLQNFNSTVELDLQNLSNDTSYYFSPAQVFPPGSAQLIIATSPKTPVGSFTAIVIATGGGKEHFERISLTIKPSSQLMNGWLILVVLIAVAASVGVIFYLRGRPREAPLDFKLTEEKDALAVVRALTKLEELKAFGKVGPDEYNRLRKEYDRKLEKLRSRRQ